MISGYTANYRLRKVSFSSRGWHVDHWYNLDLLDALIGAIDSGAAFAYTDTVGGTGNDITLDFTPDISYTTGQQIAFPVAAENTGNVTINCDGLGAKSLLTANGSEIASGMLVAGQFVKAIYNGTQFVVLYPDLDSISALTRINEGDSGAIVDAASDDFVVENTADAGMSLLVPNGQHARITFGNVTTPKAAGIHFDGPQNRLYLRSGDNERVYLNADGLVKQVNFSAFHAYKRENAGTGITQPFVITGYTEASDFNNDFDPVTGEFTAPFDGVYEFTYRINIDVAANGVNNSSFALYKNGVAVGVTQQTNNNTDVRDFYEKQFLALAAGDKIKFVIVTFGSAAPTYNNTTYRVSLTGKLVN